MICSVCAIGLHYVILKFLSVNLFLWGHELANSFLLFSVHKSFLQMIKKKISLRHRLHFLLILSSGADPEISERGGGGGGWKPNSRKEISYKYSNKRGGRGPSDHSPKSSPDHSVCRSQALSIAHELKIIY